MRRFVMSKRVTLKNVGYFIELYHIQINPQFDEEDDSNIEGWEAIEYEHTGLWQEGKNLIEAVQAVVDAINEEINHG